MALLAQIIGRAQAARTGADDGDAAAAVADLVGENARVVLRRDLVDDETFQPADGDRFSLDTDRAHRLAAARADASAGGGEGVGTVHQLQSLLVVAVAYAANVIRHVHVRRAGGDADAALDAAIGFQPRLFLAVARDHFIKRLHALVRCQHVHLDALRRVQVVTFRATVTQRILLPGGVFNTGSEVILGRVAGDPGVLVAHAQRTGGAHIHAQGAPAAAAVVEPRAQPAVAVAALECLDPDHVDGIVLADRVAGATTDTLLADIDMKTAIGGRTGTLLYRTDAGVGFLEGALPDVER